MSTIFFNAKNISRWFGTAVVFSMLGTMACAPAEFASATSLDFDATRVDAYGKNGRFGTIVGDRIFRVRGTDAVTATLTLPVDADGTILSGPPVILAQGGAVEVSRYQWLADHMASRGFVVMAPHYFANLGLFSSGDSLDVLNAVRTASLRSDDPLFDTVDATAPALIIGHSLGGVVASKAWLTAPFDVTHAVLLASIPDDADNFEEQPNITSNRHMLSVTGSLDGLITPDEVLAGAKKFEAPTVAASVDGMTHFQFTDDPTEADLAKEEAPQVDNDTGRQRALFLVDAMLDDVRGQESNSILQNPLEWPAGLSSMLISGGKNTESNTGNNQVGTNETTGDTTGGTP